jgi:hypothetical protein
MAVASGRTFGWRESCRHSGRLGGSPVTYPATSYRDTDISAWTRGACFEYRLTASKGADQGVSATAQSTADPP